MDNEQLKQTEPLTARNFVPVLHSCAGVLYAQPGILPGLLNVCVIFSASFIFIILP